MLKPIRPEYANSKKSVSMLRPALLFVKADWCQFCRNARPLMEKVARALGSAVPVYAVDADQNASLVRDLGVRSYPTILFVAANGTIHKYKGERTFDGIVGFVCTFSGGDYCAKK